MCINNKGCGTCYECQPQNASNKTYVIPVAGESAYEEWKAYYSNDYPEITTEKQWLDNWVFLWQKSGTTLERPTLNLKQGQPYFDTTLGKPIWYNLISWVDANGVEV